jgi:hypothetical protein
LGVRVSFWIGAPDGLEGLFWGSDPPLFRVWARYVEQEDPEAFSAELMSRLDRILAGGPSALVPTDRHDAEIVDAVFDAFVGFYCDTSASSLLRSASDSLVSVEWYRQARGRIESRCSRQVARCWSYLLDGRPVGRPPAPHPYTPSDVVFRLGYWTAEEVRVVLDDLRTAFPAVVRRGEERSSGGFARTPDDEVAIEIAIDATTRALGEETGLITTVA